MTKQDMTAAEKLENVEKFATAMHTIAIHNMKMAAKEDDFNDFVFACFTHDITHSLFDLIEGESYKKVLDSLMSDEDEESDDEEEENEKDKALKEQIAKLLEEVAKELISPSGK